MKNRNRLQPGLGFHKHKPGFKRRMNHAQTIRNKNIPQSELQTPPHPQHLKQKSRMHPAHHAQFEPKKNNNNQKKQKSHTSGCLKISNLRVKTSRAMMSFGIVTLSTSWREGALIGRSVMANGVPWSQLKKWAPK